MRGIEHIAWLYDLSMFVVELGGLRRWRRWLAAGAAGRVLEIGCGTGRNLTLYATPPIAIDPDLNLVLAARRRSPAARLMVADAEVLPFGAASFDTVVGSLVLCSVFDPALAVSEIRRVLRDGGSLRAIEHVRSASPVLARVQDAGQQLWTWFTGGCHPNRRTEATVAAAFEIVERRERGVMRRFVAR